jgi:hypothetical protein
LEYKPVFDDALKMLKDFEQETKEHGIVPKVQKAVFSAGW